MLVTIEVPDQFAQQFLPNEASRSRELLEAFLLQRHAEGKLSAGQVGKALRLEYYEAEQFLNEHGAPPNVTPDEQHQDLADLKCLLAR